MGPSIGALADGCVRWFRQASESSQRGVSTPDSAGGLRGNANSTSPSALRRERKNIQLYSFQGLDRKSIMLL